ncbi:hypothetical protein BJY04DRAFT_180547 [Aspergillus karnatakaensis]|uniref:uncharacterized protein n=1 Tax=Aspergillus karnatakaensis TaxID=1810916 RepID=UPI003CCC9F62
MSFFFRKRRSSSQSSQTAPPDTAPPAYHEYFSQEDSTSIKYTQIPSTDPSATHARLPKPTAEKAQFIFEDINPPAAYTSLSQAQIQAQLQSGLRTSKMLPQTQTQSQQDSESPTSLPAYDTVSGSVIVDANGYPHFLTPQEEQERKARLQAAVHERMMGLPRKTEFSWGASGSPVPPKYESRGSESAVAAAVEKGA